MIRRQLIADDVHLGFARIADQGEAVRAFEDRVFFPVAKLYRPSLFSRW
jgi:hypothetical protein